MSGKFLKIIFVALFSIGLVGQANAALIFQDSAGVDWTFVGSYNLADGPNWDDADGSCDIAGADQSTCWGDNAKPLNGIEAAELLFALAANEIFAISTINTWVDHLAYYDEYQGNVAVAKGESIVADSDSNGSYDTFGDASAYIHDRAGSDIINYVFKRTIDVPEPSALAVFALALCVFGARRLKG